MLAVELAKSGYDVTACGFGEPPLEGVDFIPLERPGRFTPSRLAQLLLRLARLHGLAERTSAPARQALRLCRELPCDLVLANDVDALPVGAWLARLRGVPLVYDAHEYAPEEFSDRLLWRLIHQGMNAYLLDKYLPRASAMLTVSPGIAEAYRDRYGVHPQVILNAPRYVDLPVKPLRDGDPIRLVHHGGAIPSRRIEEMIRAVKLLDGRFTLDLFLVAEGPTARRYLEELRSVAGGDRRIAFRRPVAMDEVVPTLNGYDVGVYLLAPANFNHISALPNKLFEFVQARLAVVVSPSPEMARVVREWGIGAVAEDFSAESLAAALAALTPARIAAYKQASDRAARELNQEREAGKLLEVVRGALGRP